MTIPGNLLTTAMAVMPHTDIDRALEMALSLDIPFWPQLPNYTYYEDMYVQAAEHFPGILLDIEGRTLKFSMDKFADEIEETMARYDGSPIEYGNSGTFMLYSSGTTGRPKGIVWEIADVPVGKMYPNLEAAVALFQITGESIYLSTQPLYHSAPAAFAITCLQVGTTVVVMEKFDAETSLALIEKYKATHSQWVPTMFVWIELSVASGPQM